MNVQPYYIFVILYYAIGFLVAFIKGISHQRKKNRYYCDAWYVLNVLHIYSIPIITCFDFLSDLTIALKWLSHNHTRHLGFLSVFILIAQRIISAFVIGDAKGWWTGVRQFFDLEVFHNLFLSLKYNRLVYGLQKYKILEGLLESFPQLVMQMYNLANENKNYDEKNWKDNNDGKLIEHISIIISLLSLSMCYLYSDVIAVVPDRLTYLKWCFIGIWRFGEVATRISVIAVFTALISAKVGGAVIFLVLLIFNIVLMGCYPDSKKATIFYNNRQTRSLSDPEQIEMSDRTQRNSRISQLLYGATERVSHTLSRKDMWQMDRELQILYREEIIPEKVSNFAIMIKNIGLWIISELGGAVFGIPALPSILPRTFVGIYYLFKFVFEGFLVALCLNHRGIESVNSIGDIIHVISVEVFADTWWYWVAGVFCFVFGGTLSFFAVNTNQWLCAMDVVGEVTLQLMKKGHHSFVERVIENGLCTVEKIIQLALQELDENHLIDGNIDLKNKPYCELLFLMLLHRIIHLGPNYYLSKEEAKNPVYWNYVVPALLSMSNKSREVNKEIMLAKLIFDKIVGEDQDSAKSYWYKKIRNAGASPTFLRFHLGVNIIFFQKNGDFNCEAKELIAESFDLLFCLKCGFSRKELEGGFAKELLDDPVFDNRDVNLEMLKKFKSKLFAMHFTVKQLKSSELFTDMELLIWFSEYYFENVNDTTPKLNDSKSYNSPEDSPLFICKNSSKSLTRRNFQYSDSKKPLEDISSESCYFSKNEEIIAPKWI